jgi:hypothetical protein
MADTDHLKKNKWEYSETEPSRFSNGYQEANENSSIDW